MTEEGFASQMAAMRSTAVSPQREQVRRLADAMRTVIEHLVATRAPEGELAAAAGTLEALAASLAGYPGPTSFEGFAESANAGDTHAFFDRSPIIGRSNPLAPPLEFSILDGRVDGRVRFGSAYEGPPGAVHGGYVAATFDEVLGMAQSISGRPGMTGTLTVRYRRPHPLHTDLRFEAELVGVEGRKIFAAGRSYDGDELLAEAEGIFITVDFSKIAELVARRPAP
jgi:acyl-coenzyme A thioesterase PaaI-like protein